MAFHLYMELSIISQKRCDRFSYHIFLVSPMSVSADHLTKLCTVISYMIKSHYLESKGVVNLVKGITDYCTSDMSNMEWLGYVRR